MMRDFKWLAPFGLILLIFSLGRVGAYMVGDNPYHRVETLDPAGKYILEWETDWKEKTVTFHVCVCTTGYVGFGLSANGKMEGADMIIGGVEKNGRPYFSDRHALGNNIPELDQSQDWKLLKARQNGSHTFLSFSRAFDTCDPQDYPITEDKISLIWAYGEKDWEVSYHHGNRGQFPILLINPDYTPKIDRDEYNFPVTIHSPYNEEVKVWSIPMQHTMSVDDTTYWCTVVKAPILNTRHHVIGFEVRFKDEPSRKALHHVIVSKCNAPRGTSTRSMFHRYLEHPGQLCYGAGGRAQSVQDIITGPIPTEYCIEYLQTTVVGDRISFHPPHVGTEIGVEPHTYYLIQAHYDNVEERAAITVSYNIDFFYTPQLRANEGQLMVVRHESPGLTPSHLIPPFETNHINLGFCGSDCTNKILPKEGIRIYAMVLHAHNYGIAMRFRHFRGDKELPHISADNNWAFDYQQMHVMNRESHILPGDQVMMECTTDTSIINGSVVGGFSTRQEMCAAWFYYYNKMPRHMTCTAEIRDQQALENMLGLYNISWSTPNLEYVVRSPRVKAGLVITEVADMIEWTEEKREELQRFQLTSPYAVRCPLVKSEREHTTDKYGELVDLETAEDEPNMVPVPRAAKPYKRPETCPSPRRDSRDRGSVSRHTGRGRVRERARIN